MTIRRLPVLLSLFLCGLTLAAAEAGSRPVGTPVDPPPRPLRMMMHWQPQAQFAGFYLALDAGFYREAGIELELLHPLTEEGGGDQLVNGEVDFYVGWLLSAMVRAAGGAPVVNIGQIAQHSGLMLAARASQGIRKLSDLNGRRVGIWLRPALRLPLQMLLRREKLQIQELPVLKNVDLFLYGGVDAINVMIYNEYYQLLASGIDPGELTLFPLKDLNMDLPEDGIYTMRDRYRKDPELCRKLTAATLRGWELAFRDKERALKAVEARCRQARVPFSNAAQRWMLDRMKELIFPDDQPHDGRLRRESFELAREILAADGEHRGVVRYETFCPDGAAAGEKKP